MRSSWYGGSSLDLDIIIFFCIFRVASGGIHLDIFIMFFCRIIVVVVATDAVDVYASTPSRDSAVSPDSQHTHTGGEKWPTKDEP